MKDRAARALAIVALVFMAIFVVMLILTMVDHTMLNGSVGYIALGAGVMVLIMLLALKADGRGFSMTKINNEIEMQKIEKELAEKEVGDKIIEENKKNAQDNAEEADGESSTETEEMSEAADEKAVDGE